MNRVASQAVTIISIVFAASSSMAKNYALNDTGVVTCRLAGGKISEECEGTWTDAAFGRDVTYPSSKNGVFGFSFAKLDSRGNELPKSAASWACTRDNVTGLIWENKTSNGDIHDGARLFDYNVRSVTGLVDQSNNEALCGYQDWRIPTRRELLGLFSASRQNSSLAFIDDQFFANTARGVYWTSDRYALSERHVAYWTIDFNSIAVTGRYNTEGELFFARVVRAGKPYGTNNFRPDNDEVIDDATGLVWRRCVAGQAWDGVTCTGFNTLMTGDQARAYSKSQSETSGKMWRVPNYKELDSIIDIKRKVAPSINQKMFPKTFNWGGAAITIDQYGLAWSFYDGQIGTISAKDVGTVRLVRDITVD